MKTNPLHAKKLLPALLALGAIAHAQPTPAAPAPETEDSDEILVLTPFVVTIEKDRGYAASNSLAGSRLNTSLKDTPATIDVFTAEFLTDLNVVDFANVIDYTNNSQLEFGDTQRSFNGIEAIAPGSTKFRSRGITASLARNYFESDINPEFYVVDRLDESRGPNSILFGIGAPGGIVNISTKQANLSRTSTTLGLKLDNESLQRYTLDHNQVIAKQKLALRLNALTQEKGSWRFNNDSEKSGFQAAVKFTPFKNTSLRAEFETGTSTAVVARNWTIRDSLFAYIDANGGVVPTTTIDFLGSSTIPAGTVRSGSRRVYIAEQGLLLNQNSSSYNTIQRGGSGSSQNLINDPALVPYEANTAGPAALADQDYDLLSLGLEQKLAQGLYAELSFQHEKGNWTNYDAAQDGDEFLNLRLDPNRYYRQDRLSILNPATTLPTATLGTVSVYENPNATEAYIDVLWRRRIEEVKRNNLRASLAYEFDLGRAGSHRLATMLQRSTKNSFAADQREFLGSELLWRRNYVTLGDARNLYAADWRTPVTDSLGNTSTWGQDPDNAVNENEETVESALVALQSYFFNKRLVTTAGLRHDSADSIRTGNNTDGTLDRTLSETFSSSATTKSGGAVLHLNKAKTLSLFANASDNIGLPNFRFRYGPDASVPPSSEADTFDAGLMFDLLDGKINGRLTYFDTSSRFNTTAMGVNRTFGPGYNDIMKALGDPNNDGDTTDRLYTDAQLAAYSKLRAYTSDLNRLPDSDSLDNDAQGYELHLTANPTKSLRMIFNYSYTEQDKSNAYTETLPRFNQLVQLVDELIRLHGSTASLAGTPNLRVPGTGNTGVAIPDLAALRSAITGQRPTDTLPAISGFIDGPIGSGSLTDRAFEFEQANGGRKHKANLFARYFFRTGLLKNFSTGGGIRYQSKIQAGTIKPADGIGDGIIVYGSELFYVDALFGYESKLPVRLFGENVKLDLQLNVRNVLNEQGIIRMRYEDDGVTLNRFLLETPREYTLSASFKF